MARATAVGCSFDPMNASEEGTENASEPLGTCDPARIKLATNNDVIILSYFYCGLSTALQVRASGNDHD